jgi:hypothetical protein
MSASWACVFQESNLIFIYSCSRIKASKLVKVTQKFRSRTYVMESRTTAEILGKIGNEGPVRRKPSKESLGSSGSAPWSCWNIGKLCEHAQCARSSDSRYILHLDCFSGYFSIIPFYFVVYSIYTRPCNVVTHPFASAPPPRDNRKSILFCLDHTNDLRLTI